MKEVTFKFYTDEGQGLGIEVTASDGVIEQANAILSNDDEALEILDSLCLKNGEDYAMLVSYAASFIDTLNDLTDLTTYEPESLQ